MLLGMSARERFESSRLAHSAQFLQSGCTMKQPFHDWLNSLMTKDDMFDMSHLTPSGTPYAHKFMFL